jgi:hypothetical protein
LSCGYDGLPPGSLFCSLCGTKIKSKWNFVFFFFFTLHQCHICLLLFLFICK